jgi:hypothetical protein
VSPAPQCKCKCSPRARLHVGGTIRGTCTCTTGRLAPWADPATEAPGWQLTTNSREIAEKFSAEKIFTNKESEWTARVTQSALTVTIVKADTAAFKCTLTLSPLPGEITLEFAPWPAAVVLKCSPADLPARGTLSARDVRVTTRMGRTIRYLIPEFTPA